jgi:hypothetical protein
LRCRPILPLQLLQQFRNRRQRSGRFQTRQLRGQQLMIIQQQQVVNDLQPS